MQPTSTKGTAASTRQSLDFVLQAVERLEAAVEGRQREIDRLRAERDQYRRLLAEQVRHLFADAKEWDNFNEKDYDARIDELLAVINSK